MNYIMVAPTVVSTNANIILNTLAKKNATKAPILSSKGRIKNLQSTG